MDIIVPAGAEFHSFVGPMLKPGEALTVEIRGIEGSVQVESITFGD